uniref:Uncharacterized protein n=1 Tax=Cacopsylla melanoneura TaxID=428564 RepID=A0A8D8ZGF8_9HEMI
MKRNEAGENEDDVEYEEIEEEYYEEEEDGEENPLGKRRKTGCGKGGNRRRKYTTRTQHCLLSIRYTTLSTVHNQNETEAEDRKKRAGKQNEKQRRNKAWRQNRREIRKKK